MRSRPSEGLSLYTSEHLHRQTQTERLEQSWRKRRSGSSALKSNDSWRCDMTRIAVAADMRATRKRIERSGSVQNTHERKRSMMMTIRASEGMRGIMRRRRLERLTRRSQRPAMRREVNIEKRRYVMKRVVEGETMSIRNQISEEKRRSARSHTSGGRKRIAKRRTGKERIKSGRRKKMGAGEEEKRRRGKEGRSMGKTRSPKRDIANAKMMLLTEESVRVKKM